MDNLTGAATLSTSVDDSSFLEIDGEKHLPTREEFYTNYPFYKYWNRESNDLIGGPRDINIYIHIPFCIQICDYCFYMKEIIKSKDQVDTYIEYLCREIELASEKFDLKSKCVNSIYIGGGTPSVLTEKQFTKLTEVLRKFHKIENPEFAFEVEPGTFNKNKLDFYKQNGVNRISMGVQSFDDHIISLSSRKHTSAQAINSIKLVKENGSFQLNIDLLSGLAGETSTTWEKSVEIALSLETDMLTIYKMKAYANTKFFLSGVHKKEIDLPGHELEISFMKLALDKIFSAEYKMWSTFAFTKNNSRSRYIENTWRGQDLIAYGVSSFGNMENINYQNINSTSNYYLKLDKKILPVYRSFPLSFKDIVVKELLLCAARLSSYSINEFIKKFGFNYFDLIPATIEELYQKGFIASTKPELMLTQKGILYSDFVSKMLSISVKNFFANDSIGYNY